MQAAMTHAKEKGIDSQPCIVLCDLQALEKLFGRTYDPERDKIWLCDSFWNLRAELVGQIQNRVSVFTNMRPVDIPTHQMCDAFSHSSKP